MSSAHDYGVEFLFPVYVPKSFVWTMKNKYPRTTTNVEYRDWSCNPVDDGRNMYLKVRRPFWPLPPNERFMPLHPDISEKKARKIRLDMDNPRGRKTPMEAIHIGYRKYSLDPTLKKLRHFNDPIPSPLATEKRAQYVNPDDRKHLKFLMDTTRSGHSPCRFPAIGIGCFEPLTKQKRIQLPLAVSLSKEEDRILIMSCQQTI